MNAIAIAFLSRKLIDLRNFDYLEHFPSSNARILKMPNANESSNPVSVFIFSPYIYTNFQSVELPPEFLQMLEGDNQEILNEMWHLPNVSKTKKLSFIDTFMKTQSDQINEAYRKWRFEIDRETVLCYSLGGYNLLIFRFLNSS